MISGHAREIEIEAKVNSFRILYTKSVIKNITWITFWVTAIFNSNNTPLYMYKLDALYEAIEDPQLFCLTRMKDVKMENVILMCETAILKPSNCKAKTEVVENNGVYLEYVVVVVREYDEDVRSCYKNVP